MSSLDSTTTRALHVIEVLRAIGQFLDSGHLFNAIQVSRHWYTSLQSLLFYNLRISYDATPLPPMEIIRANAHRVHSLHIVSKPVYASICYFWIQKFTNLERFLWTFGKILTRVLTTSQSEELIVFLKANGSKLKTIEIEYHHLLSQSFWKCLAWNCSSSLRHVSVSNVAIDSDHVAWFWLACRNLVSLKIDNVNLVPNFMTRKDIRPDSEAEALYEILEEEERDAVQVPSKRRAPTNLEEVSTNSKKPSVDSEANLESQDVCLFPHMKRLYVHRLREPISCLAEMVKHCPRLQLLEWTVHDGNMRRIFDAHGRTNMIRIASTLSTSTQTDYIVPPWFVGAPELYTSIGGALCHIYKLKPTKDQQYRLRERSSRVTQRIQALQLPYMERVPAMLCALQAHGYLEHLQDLDLRCSDLASKDAIALLSSCPQLRSIAAPEIHALDIMGACKQDWKCNELRSWEIPIECDAKAWKPTLSSQLPFDDFPLFSYPVVSAESLQVQDEDQPHPGELWVKGMMQDTCIKKLSHLTQLKVLNIGSRWGVTEVGTGVSLSVQNGLEKLAGLSHLEELSFVGMPPTEEDIHWMASNWRNLKTIVFDGKALDLSSKYLLTWRYWETHISNNSDSDSASTSDSDSDSESDSESDSDSSSESDSESDSESESGDDSANDADDNDGYGDDNGDDSVGGGGDSNDGILQLVVTLS